MTLPDWKNRLWGHHMMASGNIQHQCKRCWILPITECRCVKTSHEKTCSVEVTVNLQTGSNKALDNIVLLEPYTKVFYFTWKDFRTTVIDKQLVWATAWDTINQSQMSGPAPYVQLILVWGVIIKVTVVPGDREKFSHNVIRWALVRPGLRWGVMLTSQTPYHQNGKC